VLVALVVVAAGGVGLPELDHGVGDGAAIFVQDAAFDDDALALRFPAVIHRDVVRGGEVDLGEAGAGTLGDGLRDFDQLLGGVAQRGAFIVRAVIVIGLGTGEVGGKRRVERAHG